jgi:tetratricopeptide (TPR) repeat protein
VLADHFEALERVHEERFEPSHGPLRSAARRAAGRLLDCARLDHGFARVRCGACRAEFLVAFRCHGRSFCPSCHARRLAEWSLWLDEQLLARVPHRQVVLTLPKRLRAYFLHHRRRRGGLSRLAYRTLREYFREIRRKSLEYARQMFTRAIEIDPGFARAHCGVADCCSLLHMYYPSATPELEQADAASLRALELDPDLAEAHAARGFALFQLRRDNEAAAEFETAIRLDPSQLEARYFYGRQCFQRGQLTEAAHWFEDAARVQESVEARFFAAQAYEAAGRQEEAAAAYRRALAAAEHHLELHPDDPRAATMRAVSLCRLGEAAEGLEWARRALVIDAEDAGVRYNVACLLALEGKREQALEYLEECIRLGFGNWDWIARDPDLASLRADPRFDAMLKRG